MAVGTSHAAASQGGGHAMARSESGHHGASHDAGGGHDRAMASGRGGRHGEGHEVATRGRGGYGGGKHAMFATRHGGKASLRYASAHGYSSESTGYSSGYGGGISCVPYARQVSGIELTGNAAGWWDEAAGVYARGNRPESGSVLNFRANASMHLGHVAVVSNIVSGREIEIDHANWWGPGASKGGISRNISVIDVSPNNDWTAVRVGLGHTGDYGSIYPTYGFIYDRAIGGAPRPAIVNASAESSPMRSRRSYDEVAEAPAGRGLDLSLGRLTLDAPNRSVR